MTRITQKEMQDQLDRLNHATGQDYVLDYYPASGGYRVTTPDHSGTPYGAKRRTPKEMYDVLYFALNVVSHQRHTEG